MGGRQALGQWLMQIPSSIFGTMQFFFLLLGLKVLVEFLFRQVGLKAVRSDWIAAVLFVAVFLVMRGLQSTHLSVDLPVIFLVWGILALIVLRFGLVPLAVGAFTVDMLGNVPFTADFSAWYADHSISGAAQRSGAGGMGLLPLVGRGAAVGRGAGVSGPGRR